MHVVYTHGSKTCACTANIVVLMWCWIHTLIHVKTTPKHMIHHCNFSRTFEVRLGGGTQLFQ